MVVSEMTRKPFCHLHLIFDLINLGSIFVHDFLGKYMFQGRLVVAGIRTTVPLEWDQSGSGFRLLPARTDSDPDVSVSAAVCAAD